MIESELRLKSEVRFRMKSSRDCRGCIGAYGVDAIVRSVLYKALTAHGDDIEVWVEQPGYSCPSYWLVSHALGFPKGLSLVRWDAQTNQVQEQIEGPFGTELWIDVPWERNEQAEVGPEPHRT